jgi:SAM-dependent methyltransferase
MAEEVPAYAQLQQEVAIACGQDIGTARWALELGTGTGTTAVAVRPFHPGVALVGLDASENMLRVAAERLPGAELRIGRLQDELPAGPFDLVFSALAVHHLDGPAKADLFRRVFDVLEPGGRFVIGDLVVPEDPADVVTPVDGEFDVPSSVAEQVSWLSDAGFDAHAAWRARDLAVLVADKPG